MHLKRSCLILSLLVAAFIRPAWCQNNGARGITVGVPKAFDNRTLNLMLDNLSDSLAGLNVVDQKALGQAIGTVQGSKLQETETTLTIQDGVIPASLASPPSSPKSQPGADSLAASTKLQYSLAASDLLNEQVDLMYQIFNLRLLIDRSLSDRLLTSPDAKKDPPRLQTVIGMNVSIDPPRDAENSAAIVEVTLYRDKDSTPAERPSLVSLMPQEHTYNSAALSSKSFAFGGSAVAKVISVGYTTTHRGQTYYLFRDNDTVSFEKPTDPNGNSISFGWEFRPVLGRKSVAPGLRQMFAVISLPAQDKYAAHIEGARMVGLKADVHCWWVKYDPGSLTTADSKEIRPWDKVGHLLSFGTTLTYPPKGETKKTGYEIDVPLTTAYLNDLEAEVKQVSWHPAGVTQAVITLKGQNFFADTRIAIGDKLLSGSHDGLRLISDQSLDITTSLSALAADGAILGRYGPAKAIRVPGSEKGPLLLASAQLSEAMGGYSEIALTPRFGKISEDSPVSCLEAADLEDKKLGNPLVFLNGAPISGPYEFPLEEHSDRCLQVVARVPSALAKGPTGLIMLKFPFRAAAQASFRSYSPDSNYRSRSLDKKTYLLEKVDGAFVRSGQSKITAANWRLIVGSKAICLQSACRDGDPKVTTFCLLTPHDRFARLSIPAPTPAKKAPPLRKKSGKKHPAAPPVAPAAAGSAPAPQTVLLQYGTAEDSDPGKIDWHATYAIVLDTPKDTAAKASLDNNQKLQVNQFDEVWKSFTGQSLNTVDSVMVGSTRLQTNPAEDGKSISVFVPLAVTQKPAQIDLTFLDKQSHQIGTSQILVKQTENGKE